MLLQEFDGITMKTWQKPDLFYNINNISTVISTAQAPV